jgi:Mg2+ and Co2+ transporter CorA
LKELHSSDCENPKHVGTKLEMIEVLMADLKAFVDVSALQQTTELNKVMKFLTIFSALFIPGNFFTSIFGYDVTARRCLICAALE